jgi:flagellar hook assembly protein FlgD
MRENTGYKFNHFQNQDYNRFKILVGKTDYVEEEISSIQSEIPKEFELRQNYPNPFNAGTAISFDIPQACQAKVRIYNILGQLVVTLYDKPTYPGRYTITWDGKDEKGKEISSGIYFYQLSTPGFTKSSKMLLLK